jgi:succinyl-CoA synthetase alpha subunit
MGILIDKNTRAIVQGITGTQGMFHTKLMLEYGTKIVAGVTPGRGGTQMQGIQVYDAVEEALMRDKADATIIFVPASSALDAALESLEAGLQTVVIITEGMPIRDSVELMARAKQEAVSIVGPNCPGLIAVGECKLGIMPTQIFNEGSVGLVSRSGTLTYEVAGAISRGGLGISTCIGIGGDPIIGLSFIDILQRFRDDSSTIAVALIGEIGGDMEEKAAKYISESRYPKPVVAFIAGTSAISGKRMGHAGAIIHGNAGTAQNKINEFLDAGVRVAETTEDIVRILREFSSSM